MLTSAIHQVVVACQTTVLFTSCEDFCCSVSTYLSDPITVVSQSVNTPCHPLTVIYCDNVVILSWAVYDCVFVYMKIKCSHSSVVKMSHICDQCSVSDDAGRILTAVPWSDWKRPAGRPHTSWLSTMKMPPSWHWTGHSGGYWQRPELRTKMVQTKRWWWWLPAETYYWLKGWYLARVLLCFRKSCSLQTVADYPLGRVGSCLWPGLVHRPVFCESWIFQTSFQSLL